MKSLAVKMVSLLLTLTFFKEAYFVVQNYYETAVFGSSAVQVVEDNRSFEKFPDTFKGYIYKDSNYKLDMYFRIYLPAGYDKTKVYPVIVFLHGSGERGNDNNKQLAGDWFDALAKSVKDGEGTNPCILVAPQCPPDHEWADGSAKTQNMKSQVKDLIVKGIKKNYSVDTKRIYLTGFSMGGYGAWYITTKYPNMFAAAVPVAGGGQPGFAWLLKDVPIWAAHSLFDKSVNVINSIAMVEALKGINGNIKYTQYNDIKYGHGDAAKLIYSTPELFTWLFAQSK
ncbi:MAG: alpha/beta hydrolase-fold protein [Eubacteriales bacterium]